jgi:hypothetical protein
MHIQLRLNRNHLPQNIRRMHKMQTVIPSRNQSIPSSQADPAKSSLTFEKYQPSKFLVERAVNYEVTRATH